VVADQIERRRVGVKVPARQRALHDAAHLAASQRHEGVANSRASPRSRRGRGSCRESRAGDGLRHGLRVSRKA
jgi:hypothetical protein